LQKNALLMAASFRFSAGLPALAAVMLTGCAPTSSQSPQGVDYPPLSNAVADNEDSVRNALFVANKRGNTLSKIDLDTGEEVLRRDSCTNPHELAPSPDRELIALACYGGTSVDIFDAKTLQKLRSVDLGANARPHGILWHDSGDIYVTAEGRNSIFRVSSDANDQPTLQEFPTGKEGSHMLAVSSDETLAWTTDLQSKTVTRIDLSGRLTPFSIEVGIEPEGIDYAEKDKLLWVSARGSNKAFALDPISLVIRGELRTGEFPLRLVIRPQEDFAITSDLAEGGLSVIDLTKFEVVRSIAVSSREEAAERQQVTVLWSDDGSRIYVAETGSDTVAEVDFISGKVLRRFDVGKGGDGLAIVKQRGFFE
jgi:DNA-binding beta-propeller fold protein YncE